jgi:hypothetical protein
VKSDPAKVAVFLIIQTTSSPLTSETYTGRWRNCYLKTQTTGRQTCKYRMPKAFTSNQTEVVSLPVNKYWPTNIVAPGVTACKDQSFFFLSALSMWKQETRS